MTITKFIATITVLILLSSCNLIRTYTIFRGGKIKQANYNTHIPLEINNELMFAKVKINGKEYNYLIDTGAPNVASLEVANDLNLNPKVAISTGDSQGNKVKTGLARIKKVELGGLDFAKVGVVIADINTNVNIKCLGIDGIIGSDMMRDGIWYFDMLNNELIITNDESDLPIPENPFVLTFKANNLRAVPIINISYNSFEDSMIVFDTGSNGGLASSHDTNKKIKQHGNTAINNEISIYGVGSSGAFSRGEDDTSFISVIQNVQIGNYSTSDQIVQFDPNGRAKTIGMKFLKNYNFIINWKKRSIILIPHSDIKNSDYETFGFKFDFRDSKLVIGSIILDSEASQKLQLHDEILEINGISYRTFTEEKWCEFSFNEFVENNTAIQLLIKRGTEEKTIQLTKTTPLK